MITKVSSYEEIVAVSKAWMNRQNETKLVLEGVVTGFITFCQIPADRIRFLPWDDQHGVFALKPNQPPLPLSLSVGFDNRTDEWGVGLSVFLAQPHVRPQARVGFTVRVKAGNSDYTVTFGSLKPQVANLQSSTWCEEFYQSAAESLKESFKYGSSDTKHGFHSLLS